MIISVNLNLLLREVETVLGVLQHEYESSLSQLTDAEKETILGVIEYIEEEINIGLGFNLDE